jgi:hypothetical protein
VSNLTKYHTKQEIEAEIDISSTTSRKKLLSLMYRLLDLVNKSTSRKKEEVEMSEQELDLKIKNINPRRIDTEISQMGELAHEVHFLRKMISGVFNNNVEVSSLGSDVDRNLFIKFNELSPTQRLEEYKKLENLLLKSSL